MHPTEKTNTGLRTQTHTLPQYCNTSENTAYIKQCFCWQHESILRPKPPSPPSLSPTLTSTPPTPPSFPLWLDGCCCAAGAPAHITAYCVHLPNSNSWEERVHAMRWIYVYISLCVCVRMCVCGSSWRGRAVSNADIKHCSTGEGHGSEAWMSCTFLAHSFPSVVCVCVRVKKSR